MVYLITVFFIIITLGLAWFLISGDRGPKEPVGALWTAAGFGFLAIILSMLVESRALPWKADGIAGQFGFLLVYCLLVGIIEEASKFIPLAAAIYKKTYFDENTDGIIYFALSGMVFGLVENILYTYGYGAEAGFLRLFLTPIFHAAGTAIIGYFWARKKIYGSGLFTVTIAFMAVTLAHTFYNFGLYSGNYYFMVFSLMLTAVLALCLFLYFLKAKREDYLIGLGSEGHNVYCRHCGWKNINNTLYCEHCGQRT